MARLVTGVFWDRAAAERAYQALRSRGYNEAEVNVMMSAATRQRFFDDETAPGTELGSKALEGAGVGAGVGAVAGGVIAALAAAATVVVPGMGFMLAGPMAAALAGAGAGGVTGGVIGALIGAGIPEDRAHLYQRALENGGIVMGVGPRTDEDARYFESEWGGRGATESRAARR
jgi:hypothetical protein